MFHKTLFGPVLATLLGSCLLTGCVSIASSYRPAVTTHAPLIAPPATPQLILSGDPVGDGKRLAQDGYVLIGTSSYYGANVPPNPQDAIKQGKKVGAAVVLLMDDHATSPVAAEDKTRNVDHVDFVAVESTYAVFVSYWAKTNASSVR